MPHSVTNHDCRGAAVDGRRVKTLDGLRIATRSVFSYVHHFQSQRSCVGHGFFRGTEQEVVRPVFREPADWARAEEARDLNRYSGPLGNLRHRTNIVFMSAAGA